MPTRQKYGKQKHIHMDQHKRKVEEHNLRELERLRNRRTSLSDDMDMERALKYAKKELAAKGGNQLAKQWEVQKAVGSYHADLDSFAGFQSYKQMVLEQSAEKFSVPSSPSLPDLARSVSSSSKSRLRLAPLRRSSFNLERTLQIAHQSLNEPRPPSPLSFDTLRLADRQKDREIEKRIRDATRLPTKLPPHVLQEIKLLRSKYGIVSRAGKEQVADTDLSRLDPGGTLHWLNDEIINFYGALVLERSERFAANKENLLNGAVKKRKGKVEYLNVHYFSTFFWPKVEKSYKDTRLNKWTKKDAALIPVNHGNVHWTLAAINFRKKRIESYDSMGVHRPNVYKTLRYYLQEEHMDKKKKPFDFNGWVDHYDQDTPQQENGYDCGVFTCQFMESLSRGVDEFVFGQDDMPYLRDRMTWEIGRSRLWEESDE
ncbi:hypothetical protein JB92DRAFT_140256 [Gautieria morchelliformis]|nr:hypothetical protein JB92DRAFT_140256 [Gautieria morchelliformis]